MVSMLRESVAMTGLCGWDIPNPTFISANSPKPNIVVRNI